MYSIVDPSWVKIVHGCTIKTKINVKTFKIYLNFDNLKLTYVMSLNLKRFCFVQQIDEGLSRFLSFGIASRHMLALLLELETDEKFKDKREKRKEILNNT